MEEVKDLEEKRGVTDRVRVMGIGELRRITG